MKIENAIFGIIEIDPNEGAYLFRVPISLNGRKSLCNLFVDSVIAQNGALVGKASELLDSLEKLDQDARVALAEADKNGDETVVGFIDFHFEEVPDQIAEKLGQTSTDHGPFLRGLDLCGIGINSDTAQAVSINCDYSIGKDFTDGLLVVRFNESRRITDIAHES